MLVWGGIFLKCEQFLVILYAPDLAVIIEPSLSTISLGFGEKVVDSLFCFTCFTSTKSPTWRSLLAALFFSSASFINVLFCSFIHFSDLMFICHFIWECHSFSLFCWGKRKLSLFFYQTTVQQVIFLLSSVVWLYNAVGIWTVLVSSSYHCCFNCFANGSHESLYFSICLRPQWSYFPVVTANHFQPFSQFFTIVCFCKMRNSMPSNPAVLAGQLWLMLN